MAYLLHQVLTESAAAHPRREAARFNGESLTYEELDAATNRLARSLHAAGVRRGDRVAIYVPKSLASMIAVFGIMKAGATYVPFDPSAPAKRLAYIARDCDIRVVVSCAEKLSPLAKIVAEQAPIRTAIMIGADAARPAELDAGVRLVGWPEVERASAARLPYDGSIEADLAYILYTSGSTGTPKGVMISHRNILTFVDWSVETIGLKPTDRVTSHAPLHFDLSTFDIYATIKAGGTVVLVPQDLSLFPIQLADLLQAERVTVTYLVPSILTMMVMNGELESHDFSALRAILFAGEVFPIKNLRALAAAIPHAAYWNLYGPTETNVCTYYLVQPKDLAPNRTEPVPIGVACANTEVFAVDEAGRVVRKPGEKGELWARGPCVAQGYWGAAEKTAAVFVHNVHETRFAERAYRTGDIVYLADDGKNWIYCNRRDHMVKTRGYRVELGEIESVLNSHAGVGDAAVVAVPDETIGNRLKAYVVPAAGRNLSAGEMKRHCQERLPRYMVPESIAFLDAMPTTSSGKTDRVKLAAAAREADVASKALENV